ncbi:hypothetical protein BV898_14801 [Hypsibius exemplaris]|uniref:Eclosion hormone n=1 Tax=Hypsibius exemplaris TaxID=2072580 RepID=A0A9X6NBC1_HYPEX|nr:hypothetical protein BV898_14801 [Hypsibius exemplaris]
MKFALQLAFYGGCLISLFALAEARSTAVSGPRAKRPTMMARCIVNCAQCHDIIGFAFDHIRCSRDCIQRKDGVMPDCANPSTIRNYLNFNAMQVLAPSGKSIASQRDRLTSFNV